MMGETDLRFEQVNYTVTETGTEIRRALRAAFPGVKFSLRGSRGTGYGWFNLSWTDGPTTSAVDAVTNGFRSSYFDGMDDSTHTIPATMYADPDGVIREHRYSCHGVNGERAYSESAQLWAREYVDAHGGPDGFTPNYPGGGYDVAVWRVFQGVDLCGIDWATLPRPAPGFAGSHVPSSYCVDNGHTYGAEYVGAHRR